MGPARNGASRDSPVALAVFRVADGRQPWVSLKPGSWILLRSLTMLASREEVVVSSTTHGDVAGPPRSASPPGGRRATSSDTSNRSKSRSGPLGGTLAPGDAGEGDRSSLGKSGPAIVGSAMMTPVSDDMRPCPCGCGAKFVGMVAAREEGLRSDAAAATYDDTVLDVSEHSRVFLITGMPGAGKSTVARQLALRFDRAAHIDIDMVFHHFTVAGRVDPVHDTEERDAQSNLAVSNAAAMARNYVAGGFSCVLEGAVPLRRQVELCAEVIDPVPLRLVILAPPLAVSEARDGARSGKHVADAFRFLHPLMHRELHGMGLWIDSSDQTPEQTVATIIEHADRALESGLRGS